VEQPKKPGAAPTKDISDLKARLGLKKPEQAGPGGVPGQAPMPSAAHTMMGMPGPSLQPPGRPPAPSGFPGPASRGPVPAPMAAAQQYAAPPVAAAAPAHDPYAGMKPQQGRFDLRSIDDGVPVEKVKAGGGKAVLAASFVVGIAAFALGAGLGISSVGRANMNTANRAAKVVKAELENMQKTLNQIGGAFAASQQRMAAAKKEATSYDPKLVEDLKQIKLDPRPDTGKIFRVDYYRLEDVVVDHLFNYYYDSIALYGEVERHIRKTDNDASVLKSFVEKEASKQSKNYGVVFDTQAKVPVANLVEVGDQVCKEGGSTCSADKLEGFNIRIQTGGKPFVRKVGLKPDGMVPIKPTELMDTVMSGSPDSVRAESYKQRVNNARLLLARLNGTQKQLFEGINKAASRPDVFAPF